MRIPIPKHESYAPEPTLSVDMREHDRVIRFLDVRPWMCACGLKNFGRNEKCANYKCRMERPK